MSTPVITPETTLAELVALAGVEQSQISEIVVSPTEIVVTTVAKGTYRNDERGFRVNTAVQVVRVRSEGFT